MRLLVTGGAGFIGSALIRLAVRSGNYEIVNIDKLTYAGNLDNLREVSRSVRYAFRQIDICDSTAVRRSFQECRPDAVVHLAAESHVDHSIATPRSFIETNVGGTFTLLEAARRYYGELPAVRKARFRFLHVSTDEVFGSLDDDGMFSEATAYAPNSPYSASKAASDMLVRAWHKTYGLPVVTSNCSNNYGPYQYPEKLIPVAILSALRGAPIPVYGTGSNIRDWLYVEDHARALLAILERGTIGETYVVGGRSELRNIDLVRLICRAMDDAAPAGAPHEKLISFVTDRPGHDLRYAIDPSKIERELGWTAQMPAEAGIRATVSWYLENRWWWEGLVARRKGATPAASVMQEGEVA